MSAINGLPSGGGGMKINGAGEKVSGVLGESVQKGDLVAYRFDNGTHIGAYCDSTSKLIAKIDSAIYMYAANSGRYTWLKLTETGSWYTVKSLNSDTNGRAQSILLSDDTGLYIFDRLDSPYFCQWEVTANDMTRAAISYNGTSTTNILSYSSVSGLSSASHQGTILRDGAVYSLVYQASGQYAIVKNTPKAACKIANPSAMLSCSSAPYFVFDAQGRTYVRSVDGTNFSFDLLENGELTHICTFTPSVYSLGIGSECRSISGYYYNDNGTMYKLTNTGMQITTEPFPTLRLGTYPPVGVDENGICFYRIFECVDNAYKSSFSISGMYAIKGKKIQQLTNNTTASFEPLYCDGEYYIQCTSYAKQYSAPQWYKYGGTTGELDVGVAKESGAAGDTVTIELI